jgi:CRISPR-associated protein Csb1
VDGAEIWCVLIDSVQSQANRLEEVLLAAARGGDIRLPYVTVDFREAKLKGGLEEITSLDAPHRVYDAILRDSLLDGTPFMSSPLGLRLAEAKPADATALLEASPTALLFGAWHSTGEGGGLGAKFPRSLTSEIVAVNTPVDHYVPDQRTGEIDVRTSGQRTGSRMDPLGILRRVEVYKSESGWDISSKGAGKGAKKARPSEINHGNIAPTVQPLGVTCDYAEHTAVIGFAGLRRLGFGSSERNRTGRALLAALGLAALMEQDLRGYALRSRCELSIDGAEGLAPLELVKFDGTTEKIKLDVPAGRRLYAEAVAAAKAAGFDFADVPVRLTPQDKLVHIVRESQNRALAGEGGETDGATT